MVGSLMSSEAWGGGGDPVSDAHSKWHYDRILILAKTGSTRANIANILQAEGFKVDFVSGANGVVEELNKFGSGIFLHDFEAIDRSQSELLQQRLNRLDDIAPVIRVIMAPEITLKIMALASDAQVRRLVPYSSNLSAVAMELKMLAQTESSVGDMQRKIRLLASSASEANQEEADKIIEETYQHYGHDPAIRVEYGGVLIRKDKFEDAKVIGEQLLQKDPNNLRAMSLVSRALMKQGKMNEAIKVMENANGLAPGNTERLVSLGDAFFKIGKNDKAKSYLKQAKELDPKGGGDADKVLGQIALSEGDLTGALELFVGSCTEDESAGFFNNSAVQASKSGKPGHALELYQAALSAVKTNRLKPAIFYNIALAYSDLDLLPDALKAVNFALKIDKKFEKARRLKDKIVRDMAA